MLATFKLVRRPQFFYHILSRLVTPYHTLHTLSSRLETKLFSFGNFKISSQAQFFLSYFITPCHSLSHLITTYALGWKKNQFNLETLKLVPRSLISFHILSRIATPYHTLSPRLETKPISFGNFEIISQTRNFLSHLIMPCHSLSHLIS